MPELEALEARGYFSRGEIKAVVQRRQDFEYAFKRMAARREDYLRCVCTVGMYRGCCRRLLRNRGRRVIGHACVTLKKTR